jgi:hypothetical protein
MYTSKESSASCALKMVAATSFETLEYFEQSIRCDMLEDDNAYIVTQWVQPASTLCWFWNLESLRRCRVTIRLSNSGVRRSDLVACHHLNNTRLED